MPLFHSFRKAAAAAVIALLSTGPTPLVAQSEDTAELDALVAVIEAWRHSPHGDYASESFTHWNEDGAVPENCAACHSQPGFLDFLGTDGREAGVVNHPAAINAVIGCASCHVEEAHALDAVTLPSGVVLDGLGPNATCTVCHAGRTSSDSVSAAVDTLPADTVAPELGFINVHYGIAAAVMEGGDGRAGFHYPGQDYAGAFGHVPGADTCVACHEPHSTEVALDGCLSCHRGVEDPRDIRMQNGDFDGDGDNSGGIHAEIMGLQALLYEAIQSYAAEVAGTPIGYAEGSYPYFFADSDGDGAIAGDEAAFPNRYQSWTPRLLQAAYNYQVALQDPGGYVHNPTYLMQLLHDSIESLASQVAVDTADIARP